LIYVFIPYFFRCVVLESKGFNNTKFSILTNVNGQILHNFQFVLIINFPDWAVANDDNSFILWIDADLLCIVQYDLLGNLMIIDGF